MGRPPLAAKQKQLPVALPAETRALLETAAVAGGHSLAIEIRRRIDRTLDEETFDQQTRELADSIMWMADEVSRQVGSPWHSTKKGRHAVAVAIQQFMQATAPLEGTSEDLFGPDDPPTLGRTIARHFLQFLSQLPRTPDEMLRIIWGRRNAS
jgi:hypothetical protein